MHVCYFCWKPQCTSPGSELCYLGQIFLYGTSTTTISTTNPWNRHLTCIVWVFLNECKVLADNGYTTIFRPYKEGAVHNKDNVTITITMGTLLQGWRDKNGLWHVPLVNKVTNLQMMHFQLINQHQISQSTMFMNCHQQNKSFDIHMQPSINVDQSIQSWQLSNIPKPFNQSNQQVLTQIWKNPKGPHEVAMTKCLLNEAPDITSWARTACTYSWVKALWCLPPIHCWTIKIAFDMRSNCSLPSNLVILVFHRSSQSKMACHKKQSPGRFKTTFWLNYCKLEFVPPDIHWHNIVKQAIQTYKSHFILVLAGVDDSFLIYWLDLLIPQTVLKMNLLRQSNVEPNVMAYAYLHGQFDYNYVPLAPMGCAVQFHIKPKQQWSWGEHSIDGWYVQRSPKHY